MDLKIRKRLIVTWVNKLEDEETLSMLEALALDEETGSHALSNPPSNSDQVYQLSESELQLLEAASKEINEGKCFSNEEVIRRTEEWLNK